MKKMLAFCGLVCTDCPAFLASQSDDYAKKKEVAESWTSEKYPITADDIECDGCAAREGRLIKFCADCEVRYCGFDKSVKNCAHCDDYPCEKLKKLWDMLKRPDAKERLDDISKEL